METTTNQLLKFPRIRADHEFYGEIFIFFETLRVNVRASGFEITGYSGINNKTVDIYRLSVTIGGKKPKTLTLAISPTGNIVCYAILPLNQHGHSVLPALIVHDGLITIEEFNDVFLVILEQLKK